MFDDRTLRVLEYEQVRQLVLRYATNSLGKERIGAMAPATKLAEVAALQDETAQAVQLFDTERAVPLGSITDVRPQVSTAAKGGVLEAADLQAVAGTCYGARRLRTFLASRAEDLPALWARAEQVTVCQEIEDEVHRCIDEKGEVLDRASKELAAIRGRIRSVHGSLIQRLESMMRAPDVSKMVQEPIITIRGERYCIPVRSQFKGALRGIVHDASASGATVFMEPLAVVELNNEHIEAKRKEQEEIRRILAFISGLVGGRAADLRRTMEALGELDFIFARARYAAAARCTRPGLATDGYLELRQARHPLLAGEVVPIDIKLGREFTTLIITGPNTGGKTVSLKTVGLLTLMAQSGLQVPAADGSRVNLFRRVFADIGDEQSIAQSLSTFSSHISQIVRIMREADGKSLVLLDEIGAGTDPAEGSALAKSILGELHRRGARCVATTHYGELKAFAYSTPGIENAHVEFDTATLQPTYRLKIGVPGSSNAFAIASRLGMPGGVVEQARALLGTGQTDLEEAIRAVEQSQGVLTERQRETETLREDAEKLYRRRQEELARLQAERDRILAEAHREAERVLNDTRRQASALLDDLKQKSKHAKLLKPDEPALAAKAATASLAGMRAKVETAKPRPRPAPVEPAAAPEAAPPARKRRLRAVKLGERVFVPSVKTHGSVLALPDAEGRVEVQVGLLRMKVSLAELEPAPQQEVSISAGSLAQAAKVVEPEIMLRMLRVDEAMYALDQYLSDALVAGLRQVRIIHGYGTGAMRNAVHEALRQHPHVKGFRAGGRGEGGGGVTVASLE